MSTLLWIVLIAVVVYVIRLAGFLLPSQWVDRPLVARSAHAIPIATLAALTVSGLRIDTRDGWAQVVVIGIAGLIALRTRQIGLSIIVGLALFWLLSAINMS